MKTKNKMKDFEAKFENGGRLQRNILQRSQRRIWLNIKLMKELYGTSWKLIKRIFQISFVAIQQVQRYRARMKKQKQGPVGQLRRRKYKIERSQDFRSGATHKEDVHLEIPHDLREGVGKKNNYREFKNKKRWRLFQRYKKRYPRYNIYTLNHKLNQWGRRSKFQSKTQIYNHWFLCRLGLQHYNRGTYV